MSAHYSIGSEIRSMDDLRAIFPTGEADEMNWCLLSTSGVHGTYNTLDVVGRVEDDGYAVPHEITVLVIQPRLVCMRPGHIPFEEADAPWLRRLVSSSLAAIGASQAGNTAARADRRKIKALEALFDEGENFADYEEGKNRPKPGGRVRRCGTHSAPPRRPPIRESYPLRATARGARGRSVRRPGIEYGPRSGRSLLADILDATGSQAGEGAYDGQDPSAGVWPSRFEHHQRRRPDTCRR
jgi:hypothetical protein